MSSLAVGPIGGELLVHVVGAEIEFLCLTVLRASLCHEDLAFPLENSAWEDSVALRADALGSAYELAYLLLLWL